MQIDDSQLDAWRQKQRQNRADDHSRHGLKSGDGDGTSGGMSDDWKASVEAQLKQLHEDFRKVLGWLIAGIAVPLLAVLGLYAYTGNRADRLADSIAATQVGLAKTDAKVDEAARRLDRIERKLDDISSRLPQ